VIIAPHHPSLLDVAAEAAAVANDDWAYEQVALRGRPQLKVYREWLVRIGERAGLLADAQDTFTKALALRTKKSRRIL
jgi:hypothetical protein